MDASGMVACIEAGTFGADEVVAVIGKTEGNGGVNDFTRILADQAFRGVLKKLGNRSEADIAGIPMVWSGGCDGVITRHATVFARNAKTGPASNSSASHRSPAQNADQPQRREDHNEGHARRDRAERVDLRVRYGGG